MTLELLGAAVFNLPLTARLFGLARKMRLGFLMKLWGNHFSGPGQQVRRLRHEFAIGPLTDSALFRGKSRLYYCIRCNWHFLVGEKKVVVLDDDGHPMGGPDSSTRFATFAEGPCPALAAWEADYPIKAYIVNLEPRRTPDERRTLATGNIPFGSIWPWPVFRVFSRLREGLAKHP